jgi:hypothetical protein
LVVASETGEDPRPTPFWPRALDPTEQHPTARSTKVKTRLTSKV